MGIYRTRFTDIVQDWTDNPWSPDLYAHGAGCVDDVAPVSLGRYGAKAGDIFESIVDRVDSKDHLRLIITTNLAGPDLKNFIGARAWDRIAGHGLSIPLVGPSIRGHEPPIQKAKLTPYKPMSIDRMWEIVHDTAQHGGIFRKTASIQAALRAREGNAPFDGEKAFWDGWKKDFVAEGEGWLSSGADLRMPSGMAKAIEQAMAAKEAACDTN